MAEHQFGGEWTEIKLEILRDYLGFYTKALKRKFTLLYIDPFAGTGSRVEKVKEAPLLGETSHTKLYAGSAQIALSVNPSFDRYVFIDKQQEHVDELEKLKSRFPETTITIKKDDANIAIQKICHHHIWHKKPKEYRGVVFIDPYGLEIDWGTLEAISSTKALDVWFLFSLSGVNRQASLKHESIESYKKERLNKFFGTNDWERVFYKAVTQQDLFGERETHERIKIKEIEDWVTERLKQCFPNVLKPLPLPKTGSQLYSLFFCISNPEPAAVNLATKVAEHILKKH